MNILHIISGGEKGGSKVHLLTLSLELKKRGINSSIVCFIESDLYKEAKNLGLDITLIKQKKRFDLSVIEKIKAICEDKKIDIINCHGGRANFIAYFLKKKYPLTYITTIHSDYLSDYKGNTYKTLVYSTINKIVLKTFDGYIAVSAKFKEMLVERGFDSKKIQVVYNGIDFENKYSFNKEEILKKYNIGGYDSYITMTARMQPIKGHEIMLNAARKILDDGYNPLFILVGDGPIIEQVKQRAKELNLDKNVLFTGFTKPDEFIYISDFTLLTSYSESFPLVILESSKYKKTVVASNVGGVLEIIRDGHNGILFESKNVDKLYEGIKYLLDNKDVCNKLGENLYTDASSKYSISNMADLYLKAYEDITANLRKIDIETYFGVQVCVLDMNKTLKEIDNIINERKPSFIVAINPEKIMKAKNDEKLKNLLNSARLKIADGFGVLIASKLSGGKIKTRVTGIDLMQNICERSAKKGYKVFLLGAKPGVAENAARILKQRYKGLNIVGVKDGYFKDEDEVISDIKAKSPDILFVAMGSPKQELFITKNMKELNVPLLMGVGGSYDVICGNIKRAPKWMQSLGLEWMYRLIKEPWRYKRIMVLPKFLFEVIIDILKIN
ncbi:polymer biosynthesis protein, WecB/TagA/CpsF family [Alkalithermobacter thermoalcaliphilus JW-YL-7 = DSM 7308]|uniref:N-acetylglucosaminyldiphosphoundecaprenol N-acetyl-beta-D-mannosaminyltransferase n=1 Tax=Alkalithermobacter thermoalcaliphilus JW-YL-7 = DSM 7308 TaxID=1121328 RepID=A0A150FSC4_CLOPD|nr:glycosyl transferase, WecB/TagA/CpsF family [[Clostridium] paradoxum JW-YL-7 = DSM 7308]SHK72712.1 polymer biosynthesis protein, WecB/TagA/CpsF family [[Clostridium] paradoxum JW-YL-7 = DSM 7308]